MNLLIIFSPFAAFLMFLGLSMFIYFWAGTIAAPSKKAPGKEKMYACGEDLPAKKYFPSSAQIFHVGLFYTIMEVFALTVATIPSGNSAVIGVIYLVGISFSVAALIFR